MHYVGTLQDGSKFDSSRDRGSPFQTQIGVGEYLIEAPSHCLTFLADLHCSCLRLTRLGQVIKGWDEGVPQLSLGQKANLICTPDYAYGPRGYPPVIPANATLKFEVELLAINGKSS